MIAARVFLDVDIALRDVRLRLVVVVVTHEVANGVVWKEFFHLFIELRRKRLVVTDEERGLTGARNDIRHREGLAGTGGAQQRLELFAARESRHQLFDRLRLIASGLVGALKAEHRHNCRRVGRVRR